MYQDGDKVARDQYLRDQYLREQYFSEIYEIVDPIARSRAVAARSIQLLRVSSPDTFLGRGRFEPFSTEHETGCACLERRVDVCAQRASDD
ncbi:hypothetical protein BRAS3843_1600010 [Bradyrhizobium sp. STM 3843]|uniref:hypothetical protein n=1 Tax=Bradyrhizobium sp. STM 3843 TaxID=551947 RepID=UPI000240A93C|nr:hypothetical protein [Bradyrhizobium sp. STM 3843]CCE06128.1 hypothetical protein BRAS3843_1600010 [Bradyrhizobium sp. STM 3843]